jgi:hypothetical protein
MDVVRQIRPAATQRERDDLLFVVPAAEAVPTPMIFEDQRELNQPVLEELSREEVLAHVAALVDEAIAADQYSTLDEGLAVR